jgi:hypothetical protein
MLAAPKLTERRFPVSPEGNQFETKPLHTATPVVKAGAEKSAIPGKAARED